MKDRPTDEPPCAREDWLEPGSVDAMLRALFAESPDAIGVSKHAEICMVNPALVELFGYEDESEVVGRSVLELIAPDAQGMIAEFARRRSTGEDVPSVYRTRGVKRDGATFAIEVRSTTYLLRGEVHTLTVLRGATTERAASEAVAADEEFYRALFEINTAMKLLIAPDTGRIVDANQAAVTFYGWSKEELQKKHITEINTLTPAEVRAEMENARTGRRRYFRFRHRIASGEVRSVEVHSGPVVIDGSQLLLSIIHDVTERDIFEARLRRSQRLEAVGRLAGGVAHDFNNLLTVMQTAATMIERLVPDDSKVRAHVDDLRFAAGRAGELTRDLLALSKRQPMHREAMSLNDAVSQMAGMLARTLEEKITLRTELDPAQPSVMADRGQMERVIMNLAINARDAMPEGGELTLKTSTRRVGDLDEPSTPRGHWGVLTVADRGHGMDAETMAHVFEPFFTTKGSGSGGGLGLATVHGIITQSDGHILVDSEPGRGTRFTIYLPLAPQYSPKRS